MISKVERVESRVMKRNMSRTLDKMAKVVRQHGSLDIVDTCTLAEIAPSTFYNYIKFLTRRYEDIIYEDGKLKAIKVETVEPQS